MYRKLFNVAIHVLMLGLLLAKVHPCAAQDQESRPHPEVMALLDMGAAASQTNKSEVALLIYVNAP